MRTALLALVLLAVGVAAALNLVLGGLWVAAFAGLALWRRRFPYAAWLVLLLAVGIGVGAARLGWLGPPTGATYEQDETAWLGERLARVARFTGFGHRPRPSPLAAASHALGARLAARRDEELRHTGRQLEQRAVAAIAVSRDVARLRSRAPAEVTGVEDAVRHLALTLTAPEFRDLDAREARLAGWFAELETRLAAARDQADLDAVRLALEPAAMATVSLRALREDLARVGAASAALVRALTDGGGVGVRAATRVTYDEPRRLLVEERRFTLHATPPLRITRVDVGALRQTAPAAAAPIATQTLVYVADRGEPRPAPGGSDLALGAGAAEIVLVDRREWPAAPVPVGSALRPIRFLRLAVPETPGPPPDFPLRVLSGEGAGPEPLLLVEAGPVRLTQVTVSRHAFSSASLPGLVTSGPGGDDWAPLDPEMPASAPGGLAIELVPPSPLLRNPAFAWLRPYLYTPNAAVVLVGTVLAALASVLVGGRPRPAPPAAAVPGRT